MFKILIAAILAGAALFAFWRISAHNEGVVLAGEIYRSGQLTPAELQNVIKRYQIKTVVNLRGENSLDAWYNEEVTLCHSLGVHHVDVRWSAKKLPPPNEVADLLAAYQDAPRPILIHCLSGSDRTGLASAIFLIDQEHMPWKNASEELTWRYGHFAVYPYFEMDEFLDLYGESHAPSLRTWVKQKYPAIYAEEMQESTLHEVFEPIEYFIKDL